MRLSIAIPTKLVVACAEVARTEVACALIARTEVAGALVAGTEVTSALEMRVAAFGVFGWFQIADFILLIVWFFHVVVVELIVSIKKMSRTAERTTVRLCCYPN